ncbi:bile acid:sodium symporter family protein [Litorimonas sp. WD9-15]|uniref:bile acid:sodium symporter family protein n=1 Tax=Litorimonas sp. WD9-15 TaxID=3418716 RepID=UPI003D0243C1
MNGEALDSFQLDLGGASEFGMMVVLAAMMFSVALGLRPASFAFFKTEPRLYFTGVIAQMIALPLLTLVMCFVINPHPSVALGMILIACCPGGNTSNLIALFARANTALSVSLTATSSVFAAFVTPVSILFWSGLYLPTRALLTDINIDILSFLANTLLILALPLLLGMTFRHLAPKIAKRIQTPLAILSGIALLAIIVIASIRLLPVFMALGIGIFILVISHNCLAFALGNLAGRAIKTDTASRRALTIEVGIQNSGLGIVILLTQLGGVGGAGAVAGLWGVWHLIGGSGLALFWRWKDARSTD